MPYAMAPDGTRLYFEEHGQGEPLLLISGQGGDHRNWELVRDDFAAHHRVITADYRGTGHSDKPAEPPYSVQGFARDFVAILDYLDIPRAHAYGVSMGGRVCQWLGINHPTRIGGLVLGCTTPGNAHGVRRPPEVDALMANRPADSDERLKFYLDRLYTPAWAATHPVEVAQIRKRLDDPIPVFAQKLHYQASEAHDAWDLLPTIAAHTLVIHGSDDFVNPTANAYLLAERIRNAELCIIPGARHGFYVDFRDQASRAVLDFLSRHPL
jgi:pimeloyl-ACP methyl ester carboxylesterase